MKYLDVLQIIAVIFIIIGMVTVAGLMGVLLVDALTMQNIDVEKKVPCYDRESNEIEGLTCIEEIKICTKWGFLTSQKCSEVRR